MSKPQRGVLEFAFLPSPKSYFVTSYPHPVDKAEADDVRLVEYTPNSLPLSLVRFLKEENLIGDQDPENERPSYIMHLMAWAPPGDSTWNGSTNQDLPSYLWYVYYSASRIGSRWNVNPRGSPECPSHHPDLSLSLADLDKKPDERPSYVAIGEPRSAHADCFFVRTTEPDLSWNYRWDGLPPKCARTLQSKFVCKKPDKNGDCRLKEPRVRAVVFGYGGDWVIYGGSTKDSGESWHEFSESPHFPKELSDALVLGKRNQWTINKLSLNIRNPKEYVLAYNNGRVYYSFHEDFLEQFTRTVQQWAQRKGVRPQVEGKPLNDAEWAYQPPIHPNFGQSPEGSQIQLSESESDPMQKAPQRSHRPSAASELDPVREPGNSQLQPASPSHSRHESADATLAALLQQALQQRSQPQVTNNYYYRNATSVPMPNVPEMDPDGSSTPRSGPTPMPAPYSVPQASQPTEGRRRPKKFGFISWS